MINATSTTCVEAPTRVLMLVNDSAEVDSVISALSNRNFGICVCTNPEEAVKVGPDFGPEVVITNWDEENTRGGADLEYVCDRLSDPKGILVLSLSSRQGREAAFQRSSRFECDFAPVPSRRQNN